MERWKLRKATQHRQFRKIEVSARLMELARVALTVAHMRGLKLGGLQSNTLWLSDPPMLRQFTALPCIVAHISIQEWVALLWFLG